MGSKKTWVWVCAGIAGVGVIAVVTVAGAGVYFVTRHIKTSHSTMNDAIRSFDEARRPFGGATPLYEVDGANEPRRVRSLTDIPTSQTAASHLQVLAWDPEDERLVRVSLPMWLLRFGRQKMSMASEGRGFDLQHLNLDATELERIGPALVFDYRNHDGVRVLVWTQ